MTDLLLPKDVQVALAGALAFLFLVIGPCYAYHRNMYPISRFNPWLALFVSFVSTLTSTFGLGIPLLLSTEASVIFLHVKIVLSSLMFGGMVLLVRLAAELSMCSRKVAHRRLLVRQSCQRRPQLSNRLMRVLFATFGVSGLVWTSVAFAVDLHTLQLMTFGQNTLLMLAVSIAVVVHYREICDSLGLRAMFVVIGVAVSVANVLMTVAFSVERLDIMYVSSALCEVVVNCALLAWPLYNAYRWRARKRSLSLSARTSAAEARQPFMVGNLSLEALLKDSERLRSFEAFLASEFNVETLHFMLEAMSFDDLCTAEDTDTNMADLLSSFLHIHDTYISEEAPCQVNIGCAAREEVSAMAANVRHSRQLATPKTTTAESSASGAHSSGAPRGTASACGSVSATGNGSGSGSGSGPAGMDLTVYFVGEHSTAELQRLVAQASAEVLFVLKTDSFPRYMKELQRSRAATSKSR